MARDECIIAADLDGFEQLWCKLSVHPSLVQACSIHAGYTVLEDCSRSQCRGIRRDEVAFSFLAVLSLAALSIVPSLVALVGVEMLHSRFVNPYFLRRALRSPGDR